MSVRREADGVRESWRCRICLSADVDAVMTRCGASQCRPSSSHPLLGSSAGTACGDAVQDRSLTCVFASVEDVGCHAGHALCWDCGSACGQRCPFCRTASPVVRMYK